MLTREAWLAHLSPKTCLVSFGQRLSPHIHSLCPLESALVLFFQLYIQPLSSGYSSQDSGSSITRRSKSSGKGTDPHALMEGRTTTNREGMGLIDDLTSLYGKRAKQNY